MTDRYGPEDGTGAPDSGRGRGSSRWAARKWHEDSGRKSSGGRPTGAAGRYGSASSRRWDDDGRRTPGAWQPGGTAPWRAEAEDQRPAASRAEADRRSARAESDRRSASAEPGRRSARAESDRRSANAEPGHRSASAEPDRRGARAEPGRRSASRAEPGRRGAVRAEPGRRGSHGPSASRVRGATAASRGAAKGADVAPGRMRKVRKRAQGTDHRVRVVVTRFLLIASLVAAGLKLVQVQVFEAEALAAKATRQRVKDIPIPAARGSIVDRNGVELAFSMESKALAWQPKLRRAEIDKHNAKPKAQRLDYEQEITELAKLMVQVLGSAVSEADLLSKLRSDKTYVYLVKGVEPGKARKLTDQFPALVVENRADREYPGGDLASNVVGVANWRTDDPNQANHNLHGLNGLELLRDNELAGNPGSVTVETKEGSEVVIPGSERNHQPAVDGSDLELTIDADLQFFLQQKAGEYAKRSGAQSVSVVVLDAKTGEVYGLANDRTFDASQRGWDPKLMANPAVTTPYEPGSVNKVVTAMGAIEYGITTPDDVHSVPGHIRVADRTIRDAWAHGRLNMSTAGIFGKSSNVGTLMLADQIGPDRYADLLKKLGIGQRTGVGLPGESPGSLLPQSQWSGSTFGNLPIGQGLSMTVLQMAGMYQAIANDGVRVPPRVVKAVIKPDGSRVEEPRPEGIRVVSPQTARTTVDMFRAVAQDGQGQNDGTGPKAAVTGYQISGKTGTAQQFDRSIGRYSDSKYWITFAGIMPADDPRFVVGMVYDKPAYGTPEGVSAAPFFHDVASFLAQRYNIPLSKKASPVVPLVLP